MIIRSLLRYGIVVAANLAACADMSGLGGVASYGCKAPDGVQCSSVSGTYYNSLKQALPSQRNERLQGAMAPRGRSPADAQHGVAAPAASPRLATASASASSAYDPGSIRAEPTLLRMWYKAYADRDGDLNSDGYVYIKVDDGAWRVEHVQRLARDGYLPVLPPDEHGKAAASPTRAEPGDAAVSGPLSQALRALQPAPAPVGR